MGGFPISSSARWWWLPLYGRLPCFYFSDCEGDPKWLERLKVDYDTLKGINPRIISCSLSGYGLTGPHRDLPAFDGCIQAMGGGVSITGERGRKPVRSGIPIGDMGGTWWWRSNTLWGGG
ncbi:MAG: CoA transferase [candidate division NC10 bacterium]|nr:CoA transferase [candidate division NC10 bacterium]